MKPYERLIHNELSKIKTGSPLTVTLKTRLAIGIGDLIEDNFFKTGFKELDEAWARRRFHMGITYKELLPVLKKLKIPVKAFNKNFIGNTCAVDEESGQVLMYIHDVIHSMEYVKYKKPYLWD